MERRRPQMPRVRSDHAAVASAAVGAVVLWMLVRRRTPSRLDAGEFAACVLVLALAAGYVGASGASDELRDAARAWWGAALERFAPEEATNGANGGANGANGDEDDARAAALDDARVAVLDDATTRTAIDSARDTLMGSLGRVVTLLHRGGGTAAATDQGGEAEEAEETEDGGPGANMVLDPDVYPEPVRREYRMISGWWCQMRATAPRAYAALMRATLSRAGGPAPRPRRIGAGVEEEGGA